MGFKLNLDDVEPWKGGGVILAPGTHVVEVVEERVDESGEHPVVKLQMVAVSGEEEGGEIRDWIHITEAALGKVAGLYKAFGVEFPSGDFDWISVKGKRAKIVVRREPRKDDPTKTSTVVKGYSALDGADAAAAAFGATEVKGTDPGPEPDVPF